MTKIIHVFYVVYSKSGKHIIGDSFVKLYKVYSLKLIKED